jgi:peptidyl-prolyl cis-trans isomerase SurA
LIKPLEEVVVKTPVGKISVPTKLEHGIHILKVIEHKPLEDYELLKEELYSTVNKDERGELIRQKRINDLKKDYSFSEKSDLEASVSILDVSKLKERYNVVVKQNLKEIVESQIRFFEYIRQK